MGDYVYRPCRHDLIIFVLKIRFHSLYSAIQQSLINLIIQFYVLQINDEIWVAILYIMSVYLVALAIDGVYSHFCVCLSLSLSVRLSLFLPNLNSPKSNLICSLCSAADSTLSAPPSLPAPCHSQPKLPCFLTSTVVPRP